MSCFAVTVGFAVFTLVKLWQQIAVAISEDVCSTQGRFLSLPLFYLRGSNEGRARLHHLGRQLNGTVSQLRGKLLDSGTLTAAQYADPYMCTETGGACSPLSIISAMLRSCYSGRGNLQSSAAARVLYCYLSGVGPAWAHCRGGLGLWGCTVSSF